MKCIVVLLLTACVYVSSQSSAPTETKAISKDLDPNKVRNDESTHSFAVAAVINLAGAAVYFVLFCVLRPYFGWLYNPRNLSASKVEGAAPVLPRGIIAWLPALIRVSDEDLFRNTGLDALMYVRFFKLGVEIFSVATFLGIIMLIVNTTAGNLVTGIGTLSLANIPPNDPRLWTHLLSAYALTFSVFWLLKRNYVIYMRFRLPFMRGEGMGGDSLISRSLVVYNIPPQYRTQENLLDVFRNIYGDRMESVALTCKVSAIEKLIAKRDTSLRNLENAVASSQGGKRQEHRPGKCPCFGPKVDSVEYYTKELEGLNQQVEVEQNKAMQQKKYPVGFATMSTELDAHSIVNDKLSAFKAFELRHAPEPRDVLWDNCQHGEHARVVRWLIAKAMVIALVLFWTIPVTFVASLTTMSNLTKWLPFLTPVLSWNATLQGFIQGFLPTLALTLFMIFLPRILTAIALFEGIIAGSWVDMSVLKNFTIFSIIDIFLATTLAGSLLSVLQNGIASPLMLVNLLGQSLPGFSTFFAAYVLLKTAGLPQSMVNLVGLVIGLIRRRSAKAPRQKQMVENPGPISYGVAYSNHLLVLIIGLSYTLIAPIVPFCALLFFIVGYVVQKYQVTYVSVANYESGGAFWPLVHNRILAGLVVAQIVIIALFGLKQAPVEAALSVPLLFFTLLYYCLTEKKYRPRCASLPLDEARNTPQEAPRPVSVYQPSPLLEGGFVTNLFFPKRTTAFNPEDVSPLLEAEPNNAPGTKENIAMDVLPPHSSRSSDTTPRQRIPTTNRDTSRDRVSPMGQENIPKERVPLNTPRERGSLRSSETPRDGRGGYVQETTPRDMHAVSVRETPRNRVTGLDEFPQRTMTPMASSSSSSAATIATNPAMNTDKKREDPDRAIFTSLRFP